MGTKGSMGARSWSRSKRARRAQIARARSAKRSVIVEVLRCEDCGAETEKNHGHGAILEIDEALCRRCADEAVTAYAQVYAEEAQAFVIRERYGVERYGVEVN